MWFLRKKGNSSLRKMDAIVTGLILGSAVAAVYGMKKRRRSSGTESQPQSGFLSRILSFFKKRP